MAALGCDLAGAIIYLNLLRAQPDAAFDVNRSAEMIFIVVIGGIGTIDVDRREGELNAFAVLSRSD